MSNEQDVGKYSNHKHTNETDREITSITQEVATN